MSSPMAPVAAPLFLDLPADAAAGFAARRLAYHFTPGRGPCWVWMGGFASDMGSTKALALEQAALAAGFAFLRFDYSGHGESSGAFEAGTLSQWLADALAMLCAKAGPAPMLIGSSMGGWLALRAAQRLHDCACRPAALLLIAPAVDFTQALMWAALPQEIRDQIMQQGVWYRASAYAPDPTPITRALIEDGKAHGLLGTHPRFGMPLHIMQGGADPDVPRAHVERFMAELAAEDLRYTLIPEGDHRLSRPEDLAVLVRLALELAQEVGA